MSFLTKFYLSLECNRILSKIISKSVLKYILVVQEEYYFYYACSLSYASKFILGWNK